MTTTATSRKLLIRSVRWLLILALLPIRLGAEPEDPGSDARDKGIRFIEVGKLDEARRELSFAVNLLPGDAEASYLFGYIHLLQGRWSVSENKLDRRPFC
jgi:hypothetical protein